jgi:hypothetical protein
MTVSLPRSDVASLIAFRVRFSPCSSAVVPTKAWELVDAGGNVRHCRLSELPVPDAATAVRNASAASDRAHWNPLSPFPIEPKSAAPSQHQPVASGESNTGGDQLNATHAWCIPFCMGANPRPSALPTWAVPEEAVDVGLQVNVAHVLYGFAAVAAGAGTVAAALILWNRRRAAKVMAEYSAAAAVVEVTEDEGLDEGPVVLRVN